MPQTHVTIQGESFFINGQLTYSEIEDSSPNVRGLLMNARFIQGVFDDRAAPERFARFGHDTYDPAENTDKLIAALPEWYAHGLRAFTIGFQGGGPCFTIDNDTIHNNLFGEDGTELDPAYAERMDRLIRGADANGMVVIVSYFYGAQARRLRDGKAVRNAVATASRFLKEGGYTNVLIEIANELNISNRRGGHLAHETEAREGSFSRLASVHQVGFGTTSASWGIRLQLSEILLEIDADALQVFQYPLDLYVWIGCAELDGRRRDVAKAGCGFFDKGLEHIDPSRDVG